MFSILARNYYGGFMGIVTQGFMPTRNYSGYLQNMKTNVIDAFTTIDEKESHEEEGSTVPFSGDVF